MNDSAIIAKDLRVEYRPYVDQRPTLKGMLRGRRRTRNTVVALNDVSFEVARGEGFGIIGPNGAGKSTLLRVLARTLQPDAGTIDVRGETSTLLALGVGFNPELSGRRNVFLGGLAGGLTRVEVEERFDQIVGFAELHHAIDRPLKTYSSGMFARLAFAIGINLEPEILLVDEVLAVGDEAFQRKSKEAMRALLERAGTIVFVSHGMKQVRSLCERALWLEAGSVREIGPAGPVVRHYQQSTMVAAVAGKGARPRPAARHLGPARRVEVVLRVLGGEDPVALSEELGVPAEDIVGWRNQFVEGGRSAIAQPPSP